MTIYHVLRDYLSLTEKFLAEKQEVLQQAYQRFSTKHPNAELLFPEFEQDNDFDVFFGPHKIEHDFPNLFRKSLFITAYAIFDVNLYNRCQRLKEFYKLVSSVSDLKGKGVRRSRNYLKDVVGFDFSSSKKEWDMILSYNKLRNCLVHHDGFLNECKYEKFLRTYVSKHKSLDFDQLNRNLIWLQKGFCEESIEVFEKFEKYTDKCESASIYRNIRSEPQRAG